MIRVLIVGVVALAAFGAGDADAQTPAAAKKATPSGGTAAAQKKAPASTGPEVAVLETVLGKIVIRFQTRMRRRRPRTSRSSCVRNSTTARISTA